MDINAGGKKVMVFVERTAYFLVKKPHSPLENSPAANSILSSPSWMENTLKR